MGAMIPAMRAVVYETAIGAVLIVGLPLLAQALERGSPLLPEAAQVAGMALAVAGGALWLWATVVLVARGDGTPLPSIPRGSWSCPAPTVGCAIPCTWA